MIFIVLPLKSQVSEFDTIQFNKLFQYTNQLVEYDYYMQASLNKLNQDKQDTANTIWFGLNDKNIWHTVGGSRKNDKFIVSQHFVIDSTFRIIEFSGIYDTLRFASAGNAMVLANNYFKNILDTTVIYFDSILIPNSNNTISVWFLPAFQPSGQAVYGCEWEYIFDAAGEKLLKTNVYAGVLTGVWIGQPREIWLNYRNSDKPTIGSLYFALTFRDFYNRLSIDTRTSISTKSKDKEGNYTWSHKMKQ